MDIINQSESYTITLGFADDSGNAIVPSSAFYRIDDVDSGNQIVDWTQIYPTLSSIDLVTTAEQNGMVGNSTDREERVVTTKFYYSADNKTDTDEYRYMITRLPFLMAGNNTTP